MTSYPTAEEIRTRRQEQEDANFLRRINDPAWHGATRQEMARIPPREEEETAFLLKLARELEEE